MAPRSSTNALAATAALALLLAGCGGSSTKTASPAASGAVPAANLSKLERFAQCMRAHGDPSFPDPTPQGTFNLPPGGVAASSPQFQAADEACKSLAPPGTLSGQPPTAQQLSQAVKFVACMRKNGVPNFPDPTARGTFQGGTSPIDPGSPQFQAGLRVCRKLLPAGNGFGGAG